MRDPIANLPRPTAAFEAGDEAQVVYLLPEDEPFNEREGELFDTLPEEERRRAGGFKSLIARRQFLYGRLLLRWGVSRYVGVEPEHLTFEATEEGKLFLPAPCESFDFNLTHKPGCVAAGWVKGASIGVDAEEYEPDRANEKIARRYFAPSEVEQLEGLDGETLAWQFYRFWTLKEAYIKARGLGLKVPLKDFSFSFDDPETLEQPGEGVRIAFGGKIEDRPEDWQFQTKRVSDRHLISVALRRGTGARPGIRFFQAELRNV